MDALYIRKVLNGETEEFRYFIKQYKDLAFSVALSVVKDENLAADMVQEAFIKAYQNLKSFKGESKFSTWLYRIVVNECIKEKRKNKGSFVDIELVEDLEQEEPLELFGLQKEEQQGFYVNEALMRVSANESLVLRLYYLGENSINDICEITGWSESNVKVLMHRGRKNMEKELQKMLQSEAKTLL